MTVSLRDTKVGTWILGTDTAIIGNTLFKVYSHSLTCQPQAQMHMLLFKYRIQNNVSRRDNFYWFWGWTSTKHNLNLPALPAKYVEKNVLNPSFSFSRVSEIYKMLWAGNFLHSGFKGLNPLFKAFLSKCVGDC